MFRRGGRDLGAPSGSALPYKGTAFSHPPPLSFPNKFLPPYDYKETPSLRKGRIFSLATAAVSWRDRLIIRRLFFFSFFLITDDGLRGPPLYLCGFVPATVFSVLFSPSTCTAFPRPLRPFRHLFGTKDCSSLFFFLPTFYDLEHYVFFCPFLPFLPDALGRCGVLNGRPCAQISTHVPRFF